MAMIIDASGSGRELGRAHGEAARDLVAQALAAWTEVTLAATGAASAPDYARGLIGRTRLIEAIGHHAPALLEEIEGIAEAAGQPFELIAAYNLMDEQWWHDLGAAGVEPGCSLIGLRQPDRVLLCQNMDLPKFMDGSQVILRLRPEGQAEQVILSSAGLVGLTGASAAGIGICVNTLLMLNADAAGLAVAAVLRSALAAPDRTTAVARLRSFPHASGQHYAVAGRDGITSLEGSASGVAEVAFDEGILRHTNHPLASTDTSPAQQAILQERGRIANSQARLDHLARLRPTDAETLMEVLDAPGTPICVTPGNGRTGFTFGSIVIDCAASTTAHIRPGFPGSTGWQRVVL